ncbi:putative membrane protein [Ehrlichia cf. muris str. EmCRT]|uniref:Putative membrane protein n=1 Tax=Ehrlichia cf. muris str. EmCRT TaxID=1359167 RepID=A0A0F3ND58_9RICK|nr:putative membrane protein [Ehrlichia cf. muris str. EmCRT]
MYLYMFMDGIWMYATDLIKFIVVMVSVIRVRGYYVARRVF